MQTTEIFQEQATELTSNARYITTNQIGTKTAELYFKDNKYYIVWYRRSINFLSVHKVEEITLPTARMLFDF
jgi:hypothetical protein